MKQKKNGCKERREENPIKQDTNFLFLNRNVLEAMCEWEKTKYRSPHISRKKDVRSRTHKHGYKKRNVWEKKRTENIFLFLNKKFEMTNKSCTTYTIKHVSKAETKKKRNKIQTSPFFYFIFCQYYMEETFIHKHTNTRQRIDSEWAALRSCRPYLLVTHRYLSTATTCTVICI